MTPEQIREIAEKWYEKYRCFEEPSGISAFSYAITEALSSQWRTDEPPKDGSWIFIEHELDGQWFTAVHYYDEFFTDEQDVWFPAKEWKENIRRWMPIPQFKQPEEK